MSDCQLIGPSACGTCAGEYGEHENWCPRDANPTSAQQGETPQPPDRIWIEIYRQGYPVPTEFYTHEIPHSVEYVRVAAVETKPCCFYCDGAIAQHRETGEWMHAVSGLTTCRTLRGSKHDGINHATPRFATAPADNDAESLELLRTAAVLCVSGDGQPRVSLLFKELKDAQAVHRWLVKLVHGESPTTKETADGGGEANA